MATTSLGKLQCQNDKLSKDNTRLRDKVDEQKAEIYQLRRKINKLVEEVDDKIAKTVANALANFESNEIKQLEEENRNLKDRIFKLEQRLNISSDTSSLPPSKDSLWKKDTKVYDSRSQKSTTNNIGGQFGHKKHKLSKFNDDEITETIEHKLDKCPECNSKNLTFTGFDIHDEFDFDIKIKKIRHNFAQYKCQDCGEFINVKVPNSLCAENQYGPNVQTLGLALIDFGDVSYKRTRDFIKGITNDEIIPSEGYLGKLPKRASNNLQDFIFDCEEEIVHSTNVQHDDGVIKIGKTDKDKEDELNEIIEKKKEELTDEDKKKLNDEIKKNFKGVIRAYTNGEVMLYKAHTSKDADTYTEDNILTRLTENTTVVHDHMKYNYNDLFKFKNAECNIHAIRKGRGVKANTNHEWPDKIANLLEGFNDKKHKLMEQGIQEFNNENLIELETKYDQIINDGIVESNTFPHKHVYTDEINLLNFFKEFKKEILAWAYDWTVPFTNNLCETMIRLVKSKMKISYCFKNINTARYYADIITYTETCNNFGINRYASLNRLFCGNPYSLEELKNIKKSQSE